MPTIAERLIEQGREQGLEQGLEQGKEAVLMTLRRYLSTRFDVPLDAYDVNLTSLPLNDLTALTDAAFTAETLADFEATLQTVFPSSDN